MRTVIKNGLVYDGKGNAPVKQDILIQNDRIVRLGNIKKRGSDWVIDAAGKKIVPGFIDVGGTFDRYGTLFLESETERIVRNGVTTIIGGFCGLSLAPLLGGSLEFLKKRTGVDAGNVQWSTVHEFYRVFRKRRPTVNFYTLVGHETLVDAAVRNRERKRDLIDEEFEIVKYALNRSFAEGAVGLSFNMEDVADKNIPLRELQELVRLATRNGKIVSFHLRDYRDGLTASVDDIIQFSENESLSIHVSHCVPISGFEPIFWETVSRLERASEKTSIIFDCPYRPYVAAPIRRFLPSRLSINEITSYLLHTYDLEKFSIVYSLRPFSFSSETFLRKYAEQNRLQITDAFIRLAEQSNGAAILRYYAVSDELLRDAALSPIAIVSSGGGIPKTAESEPHPILRFLSDTAECRAIPFENALRKVTSFPAEKFGIRERGAIEENYFADIVILKDFSPERVFINGISVFHDPNV